MRMKLMPILAILVLVPGTASSERLSLAGLQQQIEQLTTTVKQLDEELARTRAELAAARTELSKVQGNSVLALDGLLRLQTVAGQNTALFEGVNVQLTNGTGMTGALNGLGNLVIGYNVDDSGLASRFGSHNIVLGDEQSYPNAEQLVTGNITSSNDLALNAAGNLATLVGISQQTTVGADQSITVGSSQTVTVGRSQGVNVGGAQTTSVGSNQTITVGNDRTEQIAGLSSTSIGAAANLSIGTDLNLSIGMTGVINGGDELLLKSGAALHTMKKNGDISIEGKQISIKGSGNIILKGSKILEN